LINNAPKVNTLECHLVVPWYVTDYRQVVPLYYLAPMDLPVIFQRLGSGKWGLRPGSRGQCFADPGAFDGIAIRWETEDRGPKAFCLDEMPAVNPDASGLTVATQ
jgi:hypothetical protein